jgi:hypothetical protein
LYSVGQAFYRVLNVSNSGSSSTIIRLGLRRDAVPTGL